MRLTKTYILTGIVLAQFLSTSMWFATVISIQLLTLLTPKLPTTYLLFPLALGPGSDSSLP
ncbi:hypothetical protein [Robertkochia sediminum]|uniref:hypothetical protein n=1 Tax=Robertkochia sediminum TaxID=2785326 RepID=UPI001931A081|nr:hypothetical protein [Robertkochia sediminum]MBL7473368.1 hypothetical protein [Robertkochia sediminum]